MVRLAIVAGGTGGHIIPAMVVAGKFRDTCRNLGIGEPSILLIGNAGGMEEKLYRNSGFLCEFISVQRLHRSLTLAHLRFPDKLVRGIFQSVNIMDTFRPDALLGTGGFVTGAVGIAAWMRGKPIFLQEQNSYPGMTNRVLARVAEQVYVGNRGGMQFLPAQKCVYTGNPVNLANLSDEKLDPETHNLRPGNKRVLVLGGSQGSKTINDNMAPIVERLLNLNVDIIWQTGEKNLKPITERFRNHKGICLFGFTDKIQQIYNSCDFAIARAGALTLAELEIKKIPSILIPLPWAAGNHQYYNAREMADRGLSEILEQDSLTPSTLFESVIRMKDRYHSMQEKFGESMHLCAAERIVNRMLNRMRKINRLSNKIPEIGNPEE